MCCSNEVELTLTTYAHICTHIHIRDIYLFTVFLTDYKLVNELKVIIIKQIIKVMI